MVTNDERREVAAKLREPFDVIGQGRYVALNGTLFGMQLLASDEGTLRAGIARLADLIEPSCDRDELLEEVKELEKCAWYFGLDFDKDEPLRDRLKEASEDFAGIASRIREALEVES